MVAVAPDGPVIAALALGFQFRPLRGMAVSSIAMCREIHERYFGGLQCEVSYLVAESLVFGFT